ncbi:MAG: murein biosynthesis integral membrane protein MurJ [Candidatus Omnitrophica bacterium]|nr:murein biosynthesis integral membrane protein MurJ [Candidatus Omnitrophota bacterium]MDD5652530.1 murein biosynthesis integral membrane protein MurJ [Candidatus Omnitrophota bacterium]
MSIHKSVAKSASVIGFATLCSRILGFIRDIVIARLFGVYVYAQAFVIAFKIPNLFRDFFGEGAANAAFVPVFSEYAAKKSKEEFWELANVVLNLLLISLSVIVVLGVIFSPLIVRLIAPGFIADPEKLALTIKLNRIIFPYCLLICLAAYSMAILNSLRHFSVPAFAPCLLNISIIVFALMFGESIKGLSLGVLVGGFLQLLIQVPVLYKKGFRLQFFKKFRHPAAKQIGKLMMPRLLSSSIYQLNNFVDTIFGSLAAIVGEGGVAGLYFAYRLILFPLGIFSNSLSQVLLPTFSTQALEDNYEKLRLSLSFGLRATFFIILPASVGFMVLSRPLVAIIFQGGKFDAFSAMVTADVLFYYSIGLVAYAATRIIQACFFALKDTVTPTKIAVLTLVMNVGLNAVLMFPMKLSGIALATSISGTVTCLVLFSILKKRIALHYTPEIYGAFLKIFAASLSMGAVCFVLSRKFSAFAVHGWLKFIYLGGLILAGIISYALFCFIFRVNEIKQLWGWVYNRRKVL